MKFIVSISLIALLSVTACMFMPWWSIAAAAMLVSILIPQKPVLSFLSGFVALLVLWGVTAYEISISNRHLLAHKISIMILSNDNPLLLVAATALTGALVAGLAALTGSFVRFGARRVHNGV